MSWLTKICKGSSHKISKERHREKPDDNDVGVCNEPTNSLLLSGYESEDLDHAIALSLFDEELRKPIFTGTKSNADEDEQLAWALQESLNTKSPPESKVSSRICAGCENEIGCGEFLNLMDVVWHPWCFRCYACDQPIIGYEFRIYDDHPYHMSCRQNLYNNKCDVCREFLPTDYRVLPIWMQKTCGSHETDGTHYCFSCNRKEPQGASYITVDDRVMLCLECLEYSIMDTDECQPLYQEIQSFYKGLNMKFDQDIMLLLVARAVIHSKATQKQGYVLRDNIIGLCITKMETVQTKFKRLKISILILKGLPRIPTGLNLAHEMMHAWLRINGYGKLNPYVEEGICVVMSYMWLDFEIMSISGSNVASSSSSSSSTLYTKSQRSQFEIKLAQICKWGLENKNGPIYGDGFRAGYTAVLKYGLKSVLDHIKLKGSFPC